MNGTAWRLLAFALSIVVLVSTVPARAGGSAPGEARRHFDTGVRLAEDRNFSGALVEFEASYRQNPTAAALQNIAVCQKSLFRYADAIATLERMVANFSAQLAPADTRAAEDAIAEMRALLGTVVIRTTPPGARVTINEQPVMPDALGKPISLSAGQYRVAVEADGYVRAEQTISVVSGQKDVPIEIALVPITGAPPAPIETPAVTPPSETPAPVTPLRGWFAYLGLAGDALNGAVPTGFQAQGPRQGASLAAIGGYRVGKRFALEGQFEIAGHVLTACPTAEPACAADRQLKYTLGTARFGPTARLMSDGRVVRAVGQLGFGAVSHTVTDVQLQAGMTSPFADKAQGAGGYLTIGGGVEVNVKHFLFDLLLTGTIETTGNLPFERRTISTGGIAVRAGYGAWKP